MLNGDVKYTVMYHTLSRLPCNELVSGMGGSCAPEPRIVSES